MQTVLGIFEDRTEADKAVDHLRGLGFNPQDMSVIVRDDIHRTTGEKGGTAMHGAMSGATTGGVIGGLAGLLIGLGAITIPGIGAFLIGGPLAAALGLTGAAATAVSGAATGALAGGLVGALTNIGLSEDEARVYESKLKEGSVLLAVPVSSVSDGYTIQDVFHSYNADQVRTIEGTNRNY